MKLEVEMDRPYHILLPYDDVAALSGLLSQAIELAEAEDGELTLLRLRPYPDPDDNEHLYAELRNLALVTAEAAIPITLTSRCGRPAQVVVDFVLDNHVDCLVLPDPQQLPLSSKAWVQQVMHEAECPFFVGVVSHPVASDYRFRLRVPMAVA